MSDEWLTRRQQDIITWGVALVGFILQLVGWPIPPNPLVLGVIVTLTGLSPIRQVQDVLNRRSGDN